MVDIWVKEKRLVFAMYLNGWHIKNRSLQQKF